jgi:L-ascorbate metabolism protein UlaG (beta-lactamase superfamily)
MKTTYLYLRMISFTAIIFCRSALILGSAGQDTIAIHNVGHASVYFEYKNLVIHIDPSSAQANYSLLPDANLILVTHGHGDHYDLSALNNIKTDSTIMITTQEVKNFGTYADSILVMHNGDSMMFMGIPVKAVPAYNIVSSTIYHPKGVGNGYILTLGEKRIYLAGDTENIPEMDSLGKIDIAFIPMNLPYTMTVSMAAAAARRINPDILYIYHFGNSDTASLRNILSDENMEIRIGKSVNYESDIRSQTTGTTKKNIDNIASFYPNPAKDFITVNNSNPGASILVYSLTGTLISETILNNNNSQSIDLRKLNSGLYIVKFHDSNLINSSLLYKE